MFGYPLALAAAIVLAGCEHDGVAVSQGRQPAGVSEAATQPAPAAAEVAEAEPVTVHQASAACWMKYERGRADLPLEARAKLVDACIDERMKAASSH
jgi:hypothetical protein